MRHSLAVMVLIILAVVLGFAFAQQNPIQHRIETYIVEQRTQPDGGVQEQFVAATSARPGQMVEYRIITTNRGDTTLPSGTVIITGPVPQSTQYVEGSATPSSEAILTEYSADGQTFSEPPVRATRNGNSVTIEPNEYRAVRWTLLTPMEPGQEQTFIYRVIVE